MTKYVPDISSRRWVIVAPKRSFRPDDKYSKHKVCVFCEGHEDKTPTEVYRVGDGQINKPGWKVRVITNKFPITDFHEVVIHGPNCDEGLHDMPVGHLQKILEVYKQRYNFYRKNGQVLIFCNMGEHAGASIEHSHSQIVVLPPQINLDSLTREPLNNMVDENTFFNVYCPDFSQWPYELWIAPKVPGTFYGDINDDQTDDLAKILHRSLKRLVKIHEEQGIKVPFAYNYYISPKENWYLRIIPRFVHRAGFELGTGLSVNIIDPSEAAELYKKAV